jgi:processive 1,2-diacylglycerol beta-glucosyltransferase
MLSAVPPRILILTASVGTGHLRAAEALELAARQVAPEAYVRKVDVLDCATRPFRRCYGQMYLDLIDLAPEVLGYFYNKMDSPPGRGGESWDRLRVKLEKMSMRPFVHLLEAEPWDLIINTHFLSAEIIAFLRAQRRLATPHVMVTTDFETHRFWAPRPCDHYFTATEEAALHLLSFGVPTRDTSAVGIPIHPVFSEPKDRAGCLARQGLPGDKPIVLQLAGGYGVGPIKEYYQALLGVETPLTVVVVTGRNAQAKKELEAVVSPARHWTKIIGFTNQIDELMAVADLVMTKPGGLTTSETLARGAPLAVVRPIPGQEDRNCDFLLENGAGIKINHVTTLAHKVESFLRDPERLALAKANARRLGRPRAAFEVVERSLALLPSVSFPSAPDRETKYAG